jgi:3-dehydroquinate synthase
MSTSLLERSRPFHVRDAIALPDDDHQLTARAMREDVYPIHVTRTLADCLRRVVSLVNGAQVALITDERVMERHGRSLLDGLDGADIGTHVFVLPAGEASKSPASAMQLWDWLASSSVGRRDVVLAFGGGVVNDTAGWVASGYMRGLPYVNVPTTLLAQVDGALGGKVAVNHAVAKNLLGAFYQPAGVVSNVEYLRTISDRHLSAGLAEAIKKAVIASPAFWEYIDGNLDAILARDPEVLWRLVRFAAAIKTALVERDPYEEDLRRPLNFGHTIGHPLETATGYGPLLHGEAVALGMVVESRIAANRGLLDDEALARLIELLRRARLPTEADDLARWPDPRAIAAALEKVRHIRAGSLRYVLPVSLGTTIVADDVTEAEAWRALGQTGFRSP